MYLQHTVLYANGGVMKPLQICMERSFFAGCVIFSEMTFDRFETDARNHVKVEGFCVVVVEVTYFALI